MKKLNLFLVTTFIFGLSAIGHVSAEVVLFKGTFERGNAVFASGISNKGTGHKGSGMPVPQSENFSGSSGEATLIVCNDAEAEKVSSATISINGNVVLGASNFNQNVECMEKTVNLNDGDNTLAVMLKSKPGGKIGIEITQPDPSGDVCDADGMYPNNVIKSIDVGIKPYGVSSTHDYVYVSNIGDGTVSAIDKESINTESPTVKTIPVGKMPTGISVSSDENYVYVSNYGDVTTNGYVSVIQTYDNSVVKTIPVGIRPIGVSSTHDYVYVSNSGDGTVSAIDKESINTESPTVKTIPVGSVPVGISAATDYVYVSNDVEGTAGYVTVIQTIDNTVVPPSIPVGKNPYGISVTPDGSYVYVSNSGDGTVSVISTSDHTVETILLNRTSSYSLSVTPDGKYVYLNNYVYSNVFVIQTCDNTVIDNSIPVGHYPYGGVAVHPDGEYVFVTNFGDNTVSVVGF